MQSAQEIEHTLYNGVISHDPRQ